MESLHATRCFMKLLGKGLAEAWAEFYPVMADPPYMCDCPNTRGDAR